MTLLLILFTAHFFADFTLQPTLWALKKYSDKKYFMFHIGTYAAIMGLVLSCCVLPSNAIRAWMFLAASHYLIDRIKIGYHNKKHRSALKELVSFCVDQTFHFAGIFVAFYLFDLPTSTTVKFAVLCTQFPIEKIVRYLLLMILLMSPSSIFIKKLTAYISCDEPIVEYKQDAPSPGSLIGKLERLIIAMLVMHEELGAIGFVLTAKSLARYKQFEDPNFTEKFLVGTLTSAAISIFLTFVLL